VLRPGRPLAGAKRQVCCLRIEQRAAIEGDPPRWRDRSRPAGSAELVCRPRSQHRSRRVAAKGDRRGKPPRGAAAAPPAWKGPWPGGPFGDRCGTRRFPVPQRFAEISRVPCIRRLLRLASRGHKPLSSTGCRRLKRAQGPSAARPAYRRPSTAQKSPAQGLGAAGMICPRQIKVVPNSPSAGAKLKAYPATGRSAAQQDPHSTWFHRTRLAGPPLAGRDRSARRPPVPPVHQREAQHARLSTVRAAEHERNPQRFQAASRRPLPPELQQDRTPAPWAATPTARAGPNRQAAAANRAGAATRGPPAPSGADSRTASVALRRESQRGG